MPDRFREDSFRSHVAKRLVCEVGNKMVFPCSLLITKDDACEDFPVMTHLAE